MLGFMKQLVSRRDSESTTRFRESKGGAEILWPTLGSSNSPLPSCPLLVSMSFYLQDQGHRLALMDEIFKDVTKEGLKCVVKVKVTQLCLILCDPMDCSLLGSSVHGIFQARVLEWVAFTFSRGSSRPRDQTRVSCIAGRQFTIWATREVLIYVLSLQAIFGTS